MQEQRANEIIVKGEVKEMKKKTVNKKLFYLLHKPVIRQSAETLKLRIVYDASTKANQVSASLDECLEMDPPLQNLLRDILICRSILLCGDMQRVI